MARRNSSQDDLYSLPDIDLLTEKQWSYLERRYQLTPRELEVAKLVCKGLTNEKIAEKLQISYRTVKVHLHSIFGKSKVHNRISILVRFAGDVNIDLLTEKQWGYLEKRYNLTLRELQVAKLVCKGLTKKEIAKELEIRPDTVKAHLRSIFAKTRVNNKMRILLKFVGEFLGDASILKINKELQI